MFLKPILFFLSQQLSEKIVSTEIYYWGKAKNDAGVMGVHLIKGQEISKEVFLVLKY